MEVTGGDGDEAAGDGAGLLLVVGAGPGAVTEAAVDTIGPLGAVTSDMDWYSGLSSLSLSSSSFLSSD